MAKTNWTPVGGAFDVALISPMEGELSGHAPFEILGNWPSPAKQPAPAPEAARYSPPPGNRGGGAAASGSASTPTTGRTTRNTGPKVMSRLTGATNSPPLSQNPNRINPQGGMTGVEFIDLVPTTEEQTALHEVPRETPETAVNTIGHEEPLAPLTVGNNHEEGPTIIITPPTQPPTTAGPSHEEIPQIVIIPPTQNPTTAASSHEDLSCPSPPLNTPPRKSPTRPNSLALVITHETPAQEIVSVSETGDDVETEEDPGLRNLEHLAEAINEDTNAPFFSWISLIPPDDPAVTVILEPQVQKIGRLLAEVSNIQAAKLRHVNELADGRPPVIPLARAFQCPSMGRVATEELVNAWNKAMLNCAQEMSLALIKEEERVEKEIRAQLMVDAMAWNFTQTESHAVKLIRDARTLEQHPYKHNPDPLVFFELTGTGDQRKITPHESAARANTSRHKIPGKAKGAKATEAEVTEAKATNTNKKPEDTVPPPKKPAKKKTPRHKAKGKSPAQPLPIQNDGSGHQGKKKSQAGPKGGARPNPGQQEVPAKAPQPVPPTVVAVVTQTVTQIQSAPAAEVTEPAVNGTQTRAVTGGPQPAPAASVAPRQTPGPGTGSDPTRHRAPAPKNNGNVNQRGGSGRITGNQTNNTAPAPSKNFQRNRTSQRYQQHPQQNPSNGNYRSNWRSGPNPPPLIQNLPSYPPPPPWAHTNWANGYRYHGGDYEAHWRPPFYVGRDGPDQNRSGWKPPFRK